MNYIYISTVYIVYTFRAYKYYYICKHIHQWIGILINTEGCTHRLHNFIHKGLFVVTYAVSHAHYTEH